MIYTTAMNINAGITNLPEDKLSLDVLNRFLHRIVLPLYLESHVPPIAVQPLRYINLDPCFSVPFNVFKVGPDPRGSFVATRVVFLL